MEIKCSKHILKLQSLLSGDILSARRSNVAIMDFRRKPLVGT
jgi:hypothetical protein